MIRMPENYDTQMVWLTRIMRISKAFRQCLVDKQQTAFNRNNMQILIFPKRLLQHIDVRHVLLIRFQVTNIINNNNGPETTIFLRMTSESVYNSIFFFSLSEKIGLMELLGPRFIPSWNFQLCDFFRSKYRLPQIITA